jgi:hypothetical protein
MRPQETRASPQCSRRHFNWAKQPCLRRATGVAILGLSGCGFPLTQMVIGRWGRGGAVAVEAVQYRETIVPGVWTQRTQHGLLPLHSGPTDPAHRWELDLLCSHGG